MAILVADGFKQYTGHDEVRAKLAHIASQSVATIEAAGPFGKYGVAPKSGAATIYHYGALNFPRPGGNAQEICASVDVKIGDLGSNGVGKVSFAVSPASWKNFNITPTGAVSQPAMVGAVMIEIVDLVPTVYHTVVTAVNTSSGVPTPNKQALGSFPTLVAGNSYTLEIRARIISPTSGEATIRINGEKATFSFNPSRVAALAGLEQAGGFGLAMIGSADSGTGRLITATDVVIYDNDSVTPWPLGAVDITYLAADDPDLAVGPASDLTYETISSETVYQIADPASGADIVGGVAYARIAAVGGSVATRAQLELVNGAETVTISDQVINPGYVSTIKSVPVSKEMIGAGSVFRARSVTP